jgi:hypothetical protein
MNALSGDTFLLGELKKIEIDGWLEIDYETEEIWIVKKASEIERIRNL